MKKLLIIFFCFQLLATMSACEKPIPVLPPDPDPEPPIEQPIDKTKLSVVWRSTYKAPSGVFGFHDLVFSGDYIVLSSIGDDDVRYPAADIRVFHKLTGELHPAWTHEAGSLYDRRQIDDCIVGGNNQNTIFATNKRELYAFDIHTGRRLWKKNITPSYYGMHAISTMGSFVLQNYGPPEALSKSWYRISAFDHLSGQERIITQLNIRDNLEFLVCPPAWTTNAESDTLLLFLTGGVNFNTHATLIDAYCYNVTQNKIEWHQKDLTPNGCSSGSKYAPIIINNNKVIFQGLYSIHCFDIGTGELIWQYDKSWQEGYAETPFLYHKGRLLVREGREGILYCYDAQTGALLWQNSVIKAYPSPWGRMDTYNDKLYFTSWKGSTARVLYCVSIATGEVEWYDTSMRIFGGVTIDQNTGYLYCNTDRSVLCVDLNKAPRK